MGYIRETPMGLRDQWLGDLRRHEREISSLSQSLLKMPPEQKRYIAYLRAQVMRHRISVALIESRLSSAAPIAIPSHSGT
jgi:hypothetical protein